MMTQLFDVHFNLAQDGFQQSWSNNLPRVQRHDGSSSIGMPEEYMTATRSQHCEAGLLKSA